ncbi:D-tyrosyl-tRNA(Tyr) deacylase 1 [Thelohanellus kitauei]|uniref:D-aminoacyl-tRNA deacylase n=1 Tax=Thelohanellus kitauei TaxID=669202 RepID=A0A0C2MK89_THEKT|nr:D-tyrosyl-tRNA(Tyr) deacylase 1 [Thelohanellus kitauei]
MKVFVHRVSRACVSVEAIKEAREIGRGICAFVGLSKNDTEDDLRKMADLMLNLKLFDDPTEKRWQMSVMDMNFDVMIVSQFTLNAAVKSNKKLDFNSSMPYQKAQVMFDQFIEIVKLTYNPDLVKVGFFGEYMNVELLADGPVSMMLESN